MRFYCSVIGSCNSRALSCAWQRADAEVNINQVFGLGILTQGIVPQAYCKNQFAIFQVKYESARDVEPRSAIREVGCFVSFEGVP